MTRRSDTMTKAKPSWQRMENSGGRNSETGIIDHSGSCSHYGIVMGRLCPIAPPHFSLGTDTLNRRNGLSLKFQQAKVEMYVFYNSRSPMISLLLPEK